MIQTAFPAYYATWTAATGDHAPISGWWRPDEDPEPFRYVQQGDLMPSLGSSPKLWVLVHELSPSLRVRSSRHPKQGLVSNEAVLPGA